jgi:phosphoribosylformylglycinamidine synthase
MDLYDQLAVPLHDRMTQCLYTSKNLPRKSFNEGLPKDLEPWFVVPLLKEGRQAMEKVNNKLGTYFLFYFLILFFFTFVYIFIKLS